MHESRARPPLFGRVAFLLAGVAISAVLVASGASAQSATCRQLSSVQGSSTPVFDPASSDVQLIVGDHYWACPCGVPRRLVGDSEQRHIVGDAEQRQVVGDSEQRHIVGDSEQRQLVGGNEQRTIVGGSEQRQIVGDNEQRKLVGAGNGLQCLRTPACAGFQLMGSSLSTVQVVAHDGIRQAPATCIVP